MPFAENNSPIPPIPPKDRPEVLVTYTASTEPRTESDRFPSDPYEYVFNAPEKIPGTTRVLRDGEGGSFIFIILPYPIRFLELTTGKTQLVLAALLHDEQIPLVGGGTMSSVDGFLGDNIEEAQEQWDTFVEQDGDPLPPPAWSGDDEDSDMDPHDAHDALGGD
jgi:hypothetical protein